MRDGFLALSCAVMFVGCCERQDLAVLYSEVGHFMKMLVSLTRKSSRNRRYAICETI